jgi:hypothetical protein
MAAQLAASQEGLSSVSMLKKEAKNIQQFYFAHIQKHLVNKKSAKSAIFKNIFVAMHICYQ